MLLSILKLPRPRRTNAAAYPVRLSRLISLAGAALAMGQWLKAYEFSQAALALAPYEPLAALNAFKALIYQHEEVELCDRLKIQAHRPAGFDLPVGALDALLASLPPREDLCSPALLAGARRRLDGLDRRKERPGQCTRIGTERAGREHLPAAGSRSGTGSRPDA